MISSLTAADFERIQRGYNSDPAASQSLQAEAYTSADWYRAEQKAVFSHSWQWVCHRCPDRILSLFSGTFRDL